MCSAHSNAAGKITTNEKITVEISTEDLKKEMLLVTDQIPALQRLHELATQKGVEVYLIGGAVPALAHFSLRRLEQRRNKIYFSKSLEPKIYNIVRLAQDIDFAIRASRGMSTEEAREITNQISDKINNEHPRFGATWQSLGINFTSVSEGGIKKDSILSNSYFFKQHSDTYSRTLVDLNPKRPLRVVDPLSLHNSDPQEHSEFLLDITQKKISLMFSKDLLENPGFAKNSNPPFMNALRSLIKASQYGVKIEADDFEIIKSIINDFDPGADHDFEFLKRLKAQAPRIYSQAFDLNHADALLAQSGLRKVIEQLATRYEAFEPVFLFLDRKPLPFFPIHTSAGVRTAKDLNLSRVVHETTDALRLESITWRPDGRINALISEVAKAGQHADFGTGFYTKNAKEGLMRSGSSVDLDIDPNAREGIDFRLVNNAKNVIILNAAAVKLNPKHLSTSNPVKLWQALAENSLGTNIKGVLEPRLVELFPAFDNLHPKKQSLVLEATQRLIDTHLAVANNMYLSWQLKLWFSAANTFARRNPQLLEQIIAAKKTTDHVYLTKLLDNKVVSHKMYIANTYLLEKLFLKISLTEFELKELCNELLKKLPQNEAYKLIELIVLNSPKRFDKDKLRADARIWLASSPKKPNEFRRQAAPSTKTNNAGDCEQLFFGKGRAGLDRLDNPEGL